MVLGGWVVRVIGWEHGTIAYSDSVVLVLVGEGWVLVGLGTWHVSLYNAFVVLVLVGEGWAIGWVGLGACHDS